MFGLFRPRCPVPEEERQWLEERWRWLEDAFGASAPVEATVVLPTADFFPDAYEPSPDAALVLFERVQRYMGLADQRVRIGFYAEQDEPWRHDPNLAGGERRGAAGLFRAGYWGAEPTIHLELGQLRDPLALVATIAHELGHVHLIGHRRLDPDETPDHEPLTDLLTVFLGLGVFSANSVIRERNWQDLGTFGWSVGRLGYLTQEAYGYALALFARARGEAKPPWADHLCTDVRAYLKQSARYLRR